MLLRILKKLIAKGYYDGLKFHRVIPNFMIQTGCPDGTGAGGPGYSIKCETKGEKQYHDRGVLSMAHRGRIPGVHSFLYAIAVQVPNTWMGFIPVLES